MRHGSDHVKEPRQDGLTRAIGFCGMCASAGATLLAELLAAVMVAGSSCSVGELLLLMANAP